MKTLVFLSGTPVSRVVGEKLNPSYFMENGVPRKSLTDAPRSGIYRRLGWVPPKGAPTPSESLAEGRRFAEQSGSKDGLAMLDTLAADYEQRHDLAQTAPSHS